METYQLEKDIPVLCITAKSFPDCVMEAFEELNALSLPVGERTLYGISRPQNGKIIYKAAVKENHPGEAKEYNCEEFIIKKGSYAVKTVHDFKDDPSGKVGSTFQELLRAPGLDPQGYCLEWYKSDNEVLCMVKLK